MSVDRWYVTVYPLRSLQCRTPRVATMVNLGVWIGLWFSPHPLAAIKQKIFRIFYYYLVILKVASCLGSFLVSLPVPLYTRTLAGEWFGPQVFCTEIFPTTTHKKTFILYNFLAVYLLPLVTICVCYLVMLYQMGRPAVEPVDNNYQVRSFVKPKGCV